METKMTQWRVGQTVFFIDRGTVAQGKFVRTLPTGSLAIHRKGELQWGTALAPHAAFSSLADAHAHIDMRKENTKLRAENARLREALAGLIGLAKMRGGYLHEYKSAVDKVEKLLS